MLNLLDNAVKHSPERETILVKAQTFQAGSPPELLEVDPALVTVEPRKFAPRTAWLQIDVMDLGAGISKDALPHVFKRFFKADQSRVRAQASGTANASLASSMPQSQGLAVSGVDMMQSGTGLGLAIAHEIVLAHQGQIAAGNHPEWQGAWFQVRLPKAQKKFKKKYRA
ncbi:MAG: sensor histidine kinase [Acaryochloridaceae cyanobacterium RL_2_7]|nr:sensor histidine kinase [Acaryochloridaceae cyanobacterium RL_2_7]